MFPMCRAIAAAALLLHAISPSSAQQFDKSPDDTLLLSRIKLKAAENLTRLPNYTCTQTIERALRGAHARKFESLDTLRLEVALVQGKELFSWPGAGRFEERGIGEIVGPGAAIGNGSFALHARAVFLSNAPRFTRVGETTLNGLRALRYDYHVPQLVSGYHIRVGPNEAFVEYRGSFWVDAATLDLIRLEVRVDKPPPTLALSESSDTMDYRRARIGDGDFLLPQSSELIMVDRDGNENRNRTQLSACRQYAGESKLRFDEPSPDVAPPPPVRLVHLPPGVSLEIRLQTPIQSGRSATGDRVTAIVSRDVKLDGEVLAPKGALLTGRITRLEKRKGEDDYYIVGLDFSTIEFENARGDFEAKLQNPGLVRNSRPSFGRARGTVRQDVIDGKILSGNAKTGGVFVVLSSHVSLPRGHSMLWRTQ
jgi:hypothetical protein